MSEKSGKHLVGWQPYLRMVAAKGFGYSIGYLLYAGICVCCVLTVLCLLMPLLDWKWQGIAGWLGVAAACAGLGLVLRWLSDKTMRGIANIEMVALLTSRHAKDLPEGETLVRPSDLSHSHRRAELLRAAQPGQETPGEELLRASVTRGITEQDR